VDAGQSSTTAAPLRACGAVNVNTAMMLGAKAEAGGLAVDGGGTRVAGSVSAR
jgi:hypothetical protein